MDYLALCEKYPTFEYENYNYTILDDTVNIEFNYNISGLSAFTTKWSISGYKNADKDILDNMIFNLGLAEMISYWKCTCSPNIKISCGNLTENQIKWWTKLFKKGLGEFLYLNNITEKHLFNMQCDGTNYTTHTVINDESVLIPIGGGKDSIVTHELLKNHINTCTYAINPNEANIKYMKDTNSIIVKRTLDKRLLDLNRQGFLNGHTPFSAIVAFSSVLVAYLNNIKYIALSNESSANESTVKNSDVNHQYSKSYEFENDFMEYIKENVVVGIEYFSFLRPLNELQIARIFSNFTQYFPIFKSCNLGSRQDIWCCNCAKCLFIYIILSPFISQETLIEIFGENLLEKESLLDILNQLTGDEKPFDCVGRRDEVNASLTYLVKNTTGPLPFLLQHYDGKADINNILNEFNDIHNVPEHFLEILRENYDRKN